MSNHRAGGHLCRLGRSRVVPGASQHQLPPTPQVCLQDSVAKITLTPVHARAHTQTHAHTHDFLWGGPSVLYPGEFFVFLNAYHLLDTAGSWMCIVLYNLHSSTEGRWGLFSSSVLQMWTLRQREVRSIASRSEAKI